MIFVMSGTQEKPRGSLDPWVIGAIVVALVVGGIVVLVSSFPTSHWTWGAGGVVVVFAFAMYSHPRHWLKRRSSVSLGIAGVTAATPAISGLVQLPKGWVEFSTDGSPLVAGLFGLLSLGFAWLDRSRPTAELAQRFEQVAGDVQQLRKATVVAPPHISLAVEKARIEEMDPRIKVKPSATLDGMHIEVTEGEIHGQLRFVGSPEQVQIALERMKRGELVDAAELGLRIEAVDAPGHPGETVKLAQILFSSSTPASLTLIHIGPDGTEYGSAELPGVIEGGLEKRFTASLGDGLFSIELQIQRDGGDRRPSAKYEMKMSTWEGHLITQLPGFTALRQVFSRLPEGGTLKFQLFHGNQFLVSGGFAEDAVKQLSPIGDTLHWLSLAREVAADLGSDIAFPGCITKEDTFEIEFARHFIDGETLPVRLNDLSAEFTAHADLIAQVLEGKEPVSLELLSDSNLRTILGTEVDLGPATMAVRDCPNYDAQIIGPDPDDPNLQIVRISLKDVPAQVTRRIQDQS